MSERGARVLLVDDDLEFLRLLSGELQAAGYRAKAVESAAAALSAMAEDPFDVVVSDLRMGSMSGVALLSELNKCYPGLPVLILTAYGSIPSAVTATRTGAFAFLAKPIDQRELKRRIEQALSLYGASHRCEDWRAGIATRSPVMEELLAIARRVAPTNSAILVSGPSGSGKEVLARAIHKASGRTGQFIPFNCAAIPADLLESELFGYRKGAFTGASRDHPGLFQQAHQGTLLLDEIGEMPGVLQSKLLRVVEEGQVRPLGGEGTTPVNVRLISATNRDLSRMIETGDFREDLFYRLNVVQLVLPRLADRREDIPALVARRLKQIAELAGSEAKSVSPEAMDRLLGDDWPGNIRQLFNVVDHAAMLSMGPVISAELVARNLGSNSSSMPSLTHARDEFTRRYLIQLIAAVEGSIARAARLAQRNRSDFYKLLKRYDIDPAAFKPARGQRDPVRSP